MLTADLVQGRRKAGELVVMKLDAAGRGRAEELAAAIVGAVGAHVGRTREELDTALDAIDVAAKDRRLKDALVKLALDRCELDGDEGTDSPALRRDVFTRAAAARRDETAPFDRAAVITEIARARGITEDALERALFGDLRQAHVLRSFAAIAPRALVDLWGPAQAQAVLLRAVKVAVDVELATPGAARALFRRLKFLRLLFTVERTEKGFRLIIDGPFSLFESVTKYGLQLALVVPALADCDRWHLVAELRWGKAREPLLYRLEGGAARGAEDADPPLPDEIAALLKSFDGMKTGWRASPARDVLDLPGVGLAVPDVVFEKDGTKVYLEVMGYWSRDAVWRRVELVEKGLGERIIFAVSARLRVSEEVLGDDQPGCLYVYKGTLNARAIAERLDALAARGSPPPARG